MEKRLFSTKKSENDSGGLKMLIFVSPIMVMEQSVLLFEWGR